MLIQQIMEKDTDNCYKALAEDGQLNETENIFYSLLSKCPEEVRFDMEQIVNRYMAKVEKMRGLIYKATYYAQRDGFVLGVRAIAQITCEITDEVDYFVKK